MSNQLAPGIQDRRSTIMGYVLALLFFVLFINIINLPRTALDQRATLRRGASRLAISGEFGHFL